MSEVRIIVANELIFYREALARAFRESRSAPEVVSVEPSRLEAEVARTKPDLVVCDRVTAEVENGVRSWVELYTDHGSRSVVCIDGHRSEVEGMEFDQLLGILDRVEESLNNRLLDEIEEVEEVEEALVKRCCELLGQTEAIRDLTKYRWCPQTA